MATRKVKLILLMMILVFGAYSILSNRSNYVSTPLMGSKSTLRAKIIETASQMLDMPYKSGGKNQAGFDCSGFVYYVMKKHEIKMAANSQGQSKQGKEIMLNKSKPGDLLFFKRSLSGPVFHVSIVKENKNNQVMMIHSSTTKGIISENISESKYWMPKLYKVTNVID